MNLKAVFNVVGILLILLAAILLLPVGVSLYYRQAALDGYFSETAAFSLTLAVALATGLGLWKFLPSGVETLRDREGFVIVSFSWISISLFGALPYYLSGVCPEFIDAYFESMSGFTTTGATILRDIDPLPRGILFWRNLTQWLGGMGIIMLSLAIFPALGIGGFHLFKAEVPGGGAVERMQPRLAETAKILWKVYLTLTGIEILLLRFGGMGWFDAVCHTFSTVATGGFSPHTASVAAFNSIYIESVIILFMLLGGINFALHYQTIRGDFKRVHQNPELRFYLSLIGLGVAFATFGLWWAEAETSLPAALRRASFQIVSINTTTGFVTDDYNAWPGFLRLCMLGIMMVGGCVGSTSGSLKVIRILVIFKVIIRELQKLVRPRGVFHVKVGGKTVKQEHILNMIGLTGLYLGVFFICALLLSLMGLDLTTAVSASTASLFNIGPGLGAVGAMGNYADLPHLAKTVVIFCMFMGRLEIYGVMMLFLPLTWKK
ncbi:MAG: TrkH family potassium uptake protein [Nitrospinales bacterium]